MTENEYKIVVKLMIEKLERLKDEIFQLQEENKILKNNARPPHDVSDVRHGEWQPCSLDDADPYFICTCCRVGYSAIYHEGEEMDYCPSCGAKMDGKGVDK